MATPATKGDKQFTYKGMTVHVYERPDLLHMQGVCGFRGDMMWKPEFFFDSGDTFDEIKAACMIMIDGPCRAEFEMAGMYPVFVGILKEE